ncbi:hypothetical protein D3C83_74960 [compost metagenome]
MIARFTLARGLEQRGDPLLDEHKLRYVAVEQNREIVEGLRKRDIPAVTGTPRSRRSSSRRTLPMPACS